MSHDAKHIRDNRASSSFDALQRIIDLLNPHRNPVRSLPFPLGVDFRLDEFLCLDGIHTTRELGTRLTEHSIDSLWSAGRGGEFPTENSFIERLAAGHVRDWDFQPADVSDL